MKIKVERFLSGLGKKKKALAFLLGALLAKKPKILPVSFFAAKWVFKLIILFVLAPIAAAFANSNSQNKVSTILTFSISAIISICSDCHSGPVISLIVILLIYD